MKRWQRIAVSYLGVIPLAFVAVVLVDWLNLNSTGVFVVQLIVVLVYFPSVGLWALEGRPLWKLLKDRPR